MTFLSKRGKITNLKTRFTVKLSIHGARKLNSFDLKIQPEPAGISSYAVR